MIEFFKFPSAFGMRDASPFVLKLETYLRLAGVEYKTTEFGDPRKAPKGKLPFIKDGDKTIADSSIIISYLKDKYGDPLSKGLSARQHAIGHAVKTMLEERTYWAFFNTRWIDEKNHQLLKETWFGVVPALMRGFVFNKVIKDMKAGMRAHGIGRHTNGEIMELALSDFAVLEAVLGDKPYLLGDKPSEYDASCYGLLANMMAKPFPSYLSKYIENSKTLSAYITRVEKKAFG